MTRHPVTRRTAAAAVAAAALGGAAILPRTARAEGRIRIAQQFGIVYLLLNVAQDLKLIEKHGKAEGVDIAVEFVRLSGGGAVNDALLSGQIDVAGAGIGPLLTIWDRPRGRQNVRGIASLGNFPFYLVTHKPAIRTLDDFGERDRIALQAVGVSVQSRILQLASAQRWGEAHWNRLDRLQVAVPHPDATAAIIKGGTEISAHFGNPPFQNQSLAQNPQAHIVLNSYDVLGGPASAVALYSAERFRSDSPRTYRAFVASLQEASRFIASVPESAADIFLRVTGSRADRDLLLSIIRSPEVRFDLTPNNTYKLAAFMHRVGAIKNAPASARDYFFDDPHNRAAS
jgi:NitT/TauT family transport system substrate-binding protein